VVTALIAGWLFALTPTAHPMHSSVAELHDSSGGTVSIRIRVFEDDFTAALGPVESQEPDSAMSRYVRGRFAITDRSGRPLSLQWRAVEHIGAVLLLQLQTKVPGGLAGSTVTSALLCDRFADQVNIVRASYGGHTTTLLFTPGDGAKALP
jgi:hypothetical protein